jgi:hypothetical protein
MAQSYTDKNLRNEVNLMDRRFQDLKFQIVRPNERKRLHHLTRLVILTLRRRYAARTPQCTVLHQTFMPNEANNAKNRKTIVASPVSSPPSVFNPCHPWLRKARSNNCVRANGQTLLHKKDFA